MIPLIPRQLFYLAQEQSFAAIARMTGIPYRTVLAMRERVIPLTVTQKASMRNAYQREAYGRLRRTGFSTKEARRWSWYRPERATIVDLSMKNKISYLTGGGIAKKLEAKGIPTSKEATEEMFDEVYEAVREGISVSDEPTETILDY